ncbi:MAG: maleylacetoacetate isomerase [Myxococcales bacterium]
MKLFESIRSSAAFRVRIALNLKGLPYEPAVLDLQAGEHHAPRYTEVNVQRAVPALVDGDRVLTQSLAIVEYLDETHPSPPLLPSSPEARARVRSIAQLIACDVHPLNNLRVLRYLEKELGQGQPARDAWYHHWVHEGFAALEATLGQPGTGRFCHGDTPTLADLCVVPQVVNAHRLAVDLAAYPRVRGIYDACMKIPAFERAHPSNHPAARP